MRLEARRVEGLPRLAWCARLSRGSETALVHHGPWVEVIGDVLFEGAWDAPYGTRPDEAACMVGTALRCEEGAVVFSAGSNAFDRLYLTLAGGDLLVSNSLVFLLVQAGDEPDPRYTGYGREFWDQSRAGMRRSRRSLRMRRGEVTLHECANLVVTPDLAVRRVEKPAGEPPRDFEGYRAQLEGAIGRVLDHAADRRRRHPYRPLATLSRGFDSPVVAALAARHGCREAICFTPWPDQVDSADDATPIGDALGLDVHAYRLDDYTARPGLPEAEFCACPPGLELPLAAAETRLEGAVLLSGHHGGAVWTKIAARTLPDLRLAPNQGVSGYSLGEFRLRVGFLHFAPCYVGFQHVAEVFRISTSEAMRPWSLGGRYDRPIPRRILEEAGVPRGLFALGKRAGGHHVLRAPEDLVPASRADYLAFVASLRIPPWRAASAALLRGAYRVSARASRAVSRWSAARGGTLRLAPPVSRHHRRPLERRYFFHWGFARVAPRYRIPQAEEATGRPPRACPDARRLVAARTLRGFADGAISLLLPAWLTHLGMGPLRVGVLVTATLLGSAALTLAVGLVAHRLAARTLLLSACGLMLATAAGLEAFDSFWPLALVAFVGTINPSSGDVSVFLPTEQFLLAESAAAADRTALFARYNVGGALGAALGALASGAPLAAGAALGGDAAFGYRLAFAAYGAVALAAFALYLPLRSGRAAAAVHGGAARPLARSRRVVLRLAALFSLDSFGGGFVVQSLLALWLFQRFQLSLQTTGTVFFSAGMLSAASQLVSPWLAQRVGLIRTMVFTHVPANVFLVLAAFMPSAGLAVACLLARMALSQMDVPARQSYVMAVVPPEERAAAASVTNVPRSLATALAPSLAGALLAASSFGWPLVCGGLLKLAYDLALFAAFRAHEPAPEEPAG